MAAILFNGAEPFEQIVNKLSTEGPMCNMAPKILTVANDDELNSFTILVIHCKFQPLVFIIY